MKDLAALVRSYERAYVEMQRAEDDETERRAERLQRAGNRIWLARYKMFEAAKQ
jgi:predicted trehalose synthase